MLPLICTIKNSASAESPLIKLNTEEERNLMANLSQSTAEGEKSSQLILKMQKAETTLASTNIKIMRLITGCHSPLHWNLEVLREKSWFMYHQILLLPS